MFNAQPTGTVISSRKWQERKEGTSWNRKATDRRLWQTLTEGYILQWMDKALVKGER